MPLYLLHFFLFFFNDTATTEIYTLSLHDALPISRTRPQRLARTLLTRQIRPAPSNSSSPARPSSARVRSEEHTSELQSHLNLVCRLLLEKKEHTPELQSHLTIVFPLSLEDNRLII